MLPTGFIVLCSESSNCDVAKLWLPRHRDADDDDDEDDDDDDHHGMSMKMHPSLTMSTAALIVCRAAQTRHSVLVSRFMPCTTRIREYLR